MDVKTWQQCEQKGWGCGYEMVLRGIYEVFTAHTLTMVLVVKTGNASEQCIGPHISRC
jgi:hypothetical protein